LEGMCTACLQVSGIKRIPINTNTVGKESMHDLLDILPAFFFLFRLDKGGTGFSYSSMCAVVQF